MTRAQVVVVGAGPSGLSLAIELGTRGIDCLLVERNDRVGLAPRAKTTNVRTRTHLRRWGIADRLAELSPFGIDYPSDIVFVTRLGGHRLARIENASNCDPARSDLYPEHGQWIPQYKLEEVLRERVESLPSVTLRFCTELVSADEHDSGVDVELRDIGTGEPWRVRCDYAVGADGARSAMRAAVGARMEGEGGLSRNSNVVFRAPGLARSHAHGPATMYWQVNPAMPGLIGPMDKDDIWFFMPTRLPDGVRVTMDNAADLIRTSTGLDLPLEILSTDEWVASSLIADRYSRGRLYLIGDACHLHPPFGGYGMNMGIADAVDLGWKLAAVLQGWGGPALLGSYEVERRGVHRRVMDEAEANHSVLSNDFLSEGLDDAGKAADALRARVGERIVALKSREFHTLGTVLSGIAPASPVLPLPEEPAPSDDRRVYRPSSAPGYLAPHFWRAEHAIYDAFGPGFVLVCGPSAAQCDVDEALRDAREQRIPLTSVLISASEAEARYPAALTLIRPDQLVAWRGGSWRPGVLAHAAGWFTPPAE